MYADGIGVARDDVKAYQYFNKLVEDYDEDAPDHRSRGAISNAFVAVGVYCLTGIPNSSVRADPERARGLFEYAATTFGDPDAQYNLAHMYITGAGGLARDEITALRWLMLAAGKGHRPSQALLGHMLFIGDGVAPQRARGLLWLTIAKNGAEGAKDEWIRGLYQSDYDAASPEDRQGRRHYARSARQGPAVALVHLPERRRDAAVPASARRADARRVALAAAGGIGLGDGGDSALSQRTASPTRFAPLPTVQTTRRDVTASQAICRLRRAAYKPSARAGPPVGGGL